MVRKKVLVTGASGLIGGLVIERLGEKYELSGLSRRPVTSIRHLQADVVDRAAIRPATNMSSTWGAKKSTVAASESPSGSLITATSSGGSSPRVTRGCGVTFSLASTLANTAPPTLPPQPRHRMRSAGDFASSARRSLAGEPLVIDEDS